MTTSRSAYAKSYNSFSGVDIKAVFNDKVLGELQAISYNITREKAPLYTMGSADPRSFSRGKRGIAGSLIFLMFDEHALLSKFGNKNDPSALFFLSDTDDVHPGSEVITDTTPISRVGIVDGSRAERQVAEAESQLTGGIGTDQEVVAPWFSDQIPPFDITLAAANEYGALAVMRLFGIEILNEGYGVSIDDIVSEQQMTYVCRTLTPWQSVALNGIDQAKLDTGPAPQSSGG